MGKYFGTDGIRGIVNDGLDARTAYKVGSAAAMVLSENRSKKQGKPLFVIGKDTRISCDMLESALTAGLCSAGADVLRLGVVPTPAVAFLAKDCDADAGIVISASHNSYEHNGIKIFNGDGFKLPDEWENRIEALIDDEESLAVKQNGDLGRIIRHTREYIKSYEDHIVACAGKIDSLHVLIDCANGAAVRPAGHIFRQFPLKYSLINDKANGVNINENCGSTHIEQLSRMVVEEKYDLGIAFDGDADRCLIVDENGNLIDGDKMMAACAISMKNRGALKKDTFVATVMSNMGLHEFAENNDISIECTKVGDRYVLERMLESGYNLGGEQSGHIIFLDDSTTGDGLLTAVKFLTVLSETREKASAILSKVATYPQVLLNIEVANGEVKNALMDDPDLKKLVADEETKLGKKGRILVRASGTEPLIRVMVEAFDENIANDLSANLTNWIKERAKSLFD